MLAFLKFFGIVNAAIWFGASCFFLLAALPAFSSAEMLRLLPPSHAGAAAHMVSERFYGVQIACGIAALVHLILEYFILGRSLKRRPVYWVAGLFGLALLIGWGFQPKIEKAHLDNYGARSTPAQREQGARMVQIWRRAARASEALVALGLLVYLWHMTTDTGPRFISSTKFRG